MIMCLHHMHRLMSALWQGNVNSPLNVLEAAGCLLMWVISGKCLVLSGFLQLRCQEAVGFAPGLLHFGRKRTAQCAVEHPEEGLFQRIVVFGLYAVRRVDRSQALHQGL